MGDQIETRISKVLNAGPDAVQKHVVDGNALELFVWMGLIFLKTHLKDRDMRVTPDLRQPDEKISDHMIGKLCITFIPLCVVS
jgi:hypothetical protein